jgi:hypothetical protein
MRTHADKSKLTRQRRWQIKMVRKGKCKICGAPAVTKFLCEKHRLAVNTRAREALHKRNRTKRRYAGAEYAGGDHAATIFHFPKWLLAEPFVLQYYPRTQNLSCMLLNGENKVIGISKSVTEAAKRSLRTKRKEQRSYRQMCSPKRVCRSVKRQTRPGSNAHSCQKHSL